MPRAVILMDSMNFGLRSAEYSRLIKAHTDDFSGPDQSRNCRETVRFASCARS